MTSSAAAHPDVGPGGPCPAAAAPQLPPPLAHWSAYQQAAGPTLQPSTGSNRSSLTAVPQCQQQLLRQLDTALHVGDLGCEEQLGGEQEVAGPEPRAPGTSGAPSEGHQSPKPRSTPRVTSFTFGSLSPMGSPAKPPGFYSPAPAPSPRSPCQHQQHFLGSPGRAPGAASPRSVRLTGSVRLVGDSIIPLPPEGLPSGQTAARQLPFTGAVDGGLEGLECVIARELSFHDLLAQAQQAKQRGQHLKPLQVVARSPRAQRPQQPCPEAAAPPCPLPPSPPAQASPALSGGAPSAPLDAGCVLSPRKRARKSLPARAACDEMDLCGPQGGGLGAQAASTG